MSGCPSDEPFAEFAAPKSSALSDLRTRHEKERRERRALWLLLAILVAASSLGSAGGTSLAAGVSELPASLGLATAGALLGLVGGWLIGVTSWASLSFQSKRPALFNPMSQELVKGNAWDKLTVWLSAWGGIGIALGGFFGATKGAELAIEAAPDSILPWSAGGSALGIVVGLVCWLVIRRRSSAEQSAPADPGRM